MSAAILFSTGHEWTELTECHAGVLVRRLAHRHCQFGLLVDICHPRGRRACMTCDKSAGKLAMNLCNTYYHTWTDFVKFCVRVSHREYHIKPKTGSDEQGVTVLQFQ